MSAKRNLLLGILALQNNFISGAQLLAGFNAWALDKRRTLGELFLAQQALTPAQHEVLQALVAMHLQKHDGDTDRSLAALSASPAKSALQSVADAEVRTSVAALADPGSDPRETLSYVGVSAGRYLIVRPHRTGGLGQVSVALDQELSRHVALKEIKPQHADDAQARTRFLLEAEVTGKLEHPGIVPVYSLGTYADGRPYYTMRFIKGDSLADAIREFHGRASGRKADVDTRYAVHVARTPRRSPEFASLAFRQRLRRLIDVCNAIAYAHDRGVLHRDLKPANIMLGQYGETLVVDWGLAKITARRAVSAQGECRSGEAGRR